MKNSKKIGTLFLAATVVSLLSSGLVGCDKGDKAASANVPAVDVNKAAVPAVPAENPATAKPKDHPAH